MWCRGLDRADQGAGRARSRQILRTSSSLISLWRVPPGVIATLPQERAIVFLQVAQQIAALLLD